MKNIIISLESFKNVKQYSKNIINQYNIQNIFTIDNSSIKNKKLKLFINFKPFFLSYGGGNQFSLFFINYLLSKNINVVYELEKNDIDIYFMIDPNKGKFKNMDLIMLFHIKKNIIIKEKFYKNQ